ncbi:MAG: hypothetical protein IKO83_11645 [Oscillospiraceae bacterium]|nr:hypothetical protein [Oscillospiraceae bacterium]
MSEYGFSGEINLDTWNSGVTRASKALDKGDVQGALREAQYVVDSYQKHRRGTDKWQKAVAIIAGIFIVIAVILGISTGEWIVAIVFGVIGLVISGFLNNKIVDKRIAVDNAFYDSYEHLAGAIEDLTRNQ